jgi:hypothetical protein
MVQHGFKYGSLAAEDIAGHREKKLGGGDSELEVIAKKIL